MIRILIVDDEPLAREELSRLINKHPGFQVVNTAANGQEALNWLTKQQADAIFLDIEMPVLNGLETASRLSEWEQQPLVVFATAYDRYAVEAFDRNAVDYLLKPYEPARLEKSLRRIEDVLKAHKNTRDSLRNLDHDLAARGMVKKLVGYKRGSRDRMVINPEDVLFFNVEYSEIHARIGAEDVLVNATLKVLLEQLAQADFAQTHKSYIVNLNKVQKVVAMFSGNYELVLKDTAGTKVPLSRRYAKGLKTRLGGW